MILEVLDFGIMEQEVAETVLSTALFGYKYALIESRDTFSALCLTTLIV